MRRASWCRSPAQALAYLFGFFVNGADQPGAVLDHHRGVVRNSVKS